MKFILSGGGHPEKTKSLDKFFIKIMPKKAKILYIPIAKKTRPFEDCFSWIKNTLDEMGYKGNIEMWCNLENKTPKDIKKFDSIYIGGGNTFSLLKDLKKTGFFKILKDYIINGGLVYGISAGAIIFSEDIFLAESAGDKNNVNLKDTSALSILKNYFIWPHYQSKQDRKILNHIKKKKINILAIPEGAGLYHSGKDSFVKGKGYVYVFSGSSKKRYKKEEKIPYYSF